MSVVLSLSWWRIVNSEDFSERQRSVLNLFHFSSTIVVLLLLCLALLLYITEEKIARSRMLIVLTRAIVRQNSLQSRLASEDIPGSGRKAPGLLKGTMLSSNWAVSAFVGTPRVQTWWLPFFFILPIAGKPRAITRLLSVCNTRSVVPRDDTGVFASPRSRRLSLAIFC